MYYIYYIQNTINKKYYIGLTNNWKRRKKRHFSDLRCGRHDNKHLQNSFNKYGESSFIFKVILEKDCTLGEISDLEKVFIKKYNSFCGGYNMNEGGFDNNGFVSRFSKKDIFNILATLYHVNMSGTFLADLYKTTSATISRIHRGESHGEYKKEFDELCLDEKKSIYEKFNSLHDVHYNTRLRLNSANRKFHDSVYLKILAYTEKHKRKGAHISRVLGCDPSTIKLFIQGKTNDDIHIYYQRLSLKEKKNLYIESKNLFENNASLCGDT